MNVADRQCGRDGFTFLQCRPAKWKECRGIKSIFKVMVLHCLAVATYGFRYIRLKEHLRQVEVPRLPMIDLPHLQILRVTDHLVQVTESKLGHQLTYFLRDEVHEVDQV